MTFAALDKNTCEYVHLPDIIPPNAETHAEVDHLRAQNLHPPSSTPQKVIAKFNLIGLEASLLFGILPLKDIGDGVISFGDPLQLGLGTHVVKSTLNK